MNLVEQANKLVREIERAKRLRILSQYPEWKEMAASIAAEIGAKIDALCQPTCTDDEAKGLRASIWALRWFVAVPKVSDKQFVETAAKLEDLRARVTRLHTTGQLGSQDAKAVSDEIEKLSTNLQSVT